MLTLNVCPGLISPGAATLTTVSAAIAGRGETKMTASKTKRIKALTKRIRKETGFMSEFIENIKTKSKLD